MEADAAAASAGAAAAIEGDAGAASAAAAAAAATAAAAPPSHRAMEGDAGAASAAAAAGYINRQHMIWFTVLRWIFLRTADMRLFSLCAHCSPERSFMKAIYSLMTRVGECFQMRN